MSPLLFVLVAELLKCIINKAHQIGLIQMPIPPRGNPDFPIIQYADDTFPIMKTSQRELLCLSHPEGTLMFVSNLLHSSGLACSRTSKSLSLGDVLALIKRQFHTPTCRVYV
jgi:hypothetical protein